MRTLAYWQRQAERIVEHEHMQADNTIHELDQAYEERTSSIESAMLLFFATYAVDGVVTFADSRKYLDPQQMRSFKRMVNNFIVEANDREWLKQLKKIHKRKRISRYDALAVQIRHNVEMIGTIQKSHRLASNVYSDTYYRTIFAVQKGLGFGTTFTKLNNNAVDRAIYGRWLNMDFSSRIWYDKNKLLREMDTIVKQGFIRGDSVDKMTRELAKRMEVSKSNAATLVRTETAYMAAEATYKAYRGAGVKQYQYLATLDNRTSDICQSMDLKVFNLSEREEGVNWPPLHFNCRSTTMPYIEDNDGVRIARDADGKTYNVPANMTYKQWYKKHVVGKG